MSIVESLTGNRVVRGAADAILARFACRRTLFLDHLDSAAVQERTLLRLVRHARDTQFGIEHDFARMRTVADFQARVPLYQYEDYWNGYWKTAYPHLDNITWPGWVPYYALSSGTTSGATKYIPVSREMLSSNRKAAFTTLALYRHLYPHEPLFNGRVFFLGGSTELQHLPDGSRAGDLSAISAIEVLGLLRPYTFPPLSLTAISDWETKVRRLAEESVRLPITVLSGVPAWMLVLFDHMNRITGKASIGEIWPELRVLIHGGTKFEPYRDLFRKEIGSDRVRFLEVYPCSEGFVATEDPRYNMLRLVPDHGIFFEFVPVDELDRDRPTRHTLRTVEPGVQYAVVMTTCAGLWSYIVGDTIAFEQREPPLLRFTGRTKYFLSAFGEHLISEEIEQAVAEAANRTGASVQEFHVGPVFPTDPRQPGHHRYLVEFSRLPEDVQRFAGEIDTALARLNEDYRAHRTGDLSMGGPEVVQVKTGGFLAWMLAHGKRPPQHKVPRMDNTGTLTESMRLWLQQNAELKESSE